MKITSQANQASPASTSQTLVVAGRGHVQTFALSKAHVKIGRAPVCDIVIDDSELSREHLMIHLGPPVEVQDLGSTNGTRVAGVVHRGGVPVAFAPDAGFQVGSLSFLVMAAHNHTPSTLRSANEQTSVPDPTPEGVSGFVQDVAKADVPILILGESGVGKEVLAETLHLLSGRTGRMQRINCAALPEQLLESELFGHEKGAFTGATAAREGLLEAAVGGSVFLDEIGEIPLAMQAKLLRAIEAREIVRLGASQATRIDVRYICATNRDLAGEVAAKRFRADLFFRIDGISLRIPPLRDRPGVIAPLAMQFAQSAGNQVPLSIQVLEALRQHTWPGNVRELKAVMGRAALLAGGQPIKPSHLLFSGGSVVAPAVAPPRGNAVPTPPSLRAARAVPTELAGFVAGLSEADRRERERIEDALQACNGNQSRAAAKLGISRSTLVTKLRLFRIPRPRASL